MKIPMNVLLFLAALLLLAGCGGSGDSPPPVTGWAVGVMPDKTTPAILETQDGISWTRIISDKFLRSGEGRNVSAIDSQCAWISINSAEVNTPGQVLRTLDGGATWENVTPVVWPPNSINNYVNIKALSRDVAWVATSNYLASTNDGGKTWTPVTPSGFHNGEQYSYTHLDALDSKHAWAIGGITFANSSSAALVVRTRDGIAWETMPAIPDEKNLLGLAVTSPNTVRVTTNNNATLYTSYDGGETFPVRVQLMNNPVGNDLNDVAVYGQYVWTVQDRAIFSRATDGGYNFVNSKLPNFGDHGYSNLYAVALSALDEKRIWVGGVADIGSPGGLLWSNDGGQNWHEPSPSLYGYDIWRVSFVGGVK